MAATVSFTSSLYLGLLHPHEALPPWRRLTSGMPAVLGELAPTARVTRAFARLVGVERAISSRSTLHAMWDVFGEVVRDPQRFIVLVDAGTYEVARWALCQATVRGVPLLEFSHHDPFHLRRRLAGRAHAGRRPVVVTDGLCPGCGMAPLADYLEEVRHHDGLLVVDDTQAVGVLGAHPTASEPYGRGGGGSCRWAGVGTDSVVIVASLAKGLGAPLTVTGGSSDLLRRLALGDTRTHCSPPSVADLAAAEASLTVNRQRGDTLRRRLAGLVGHLRAGLECLGVAGRRDMFPVQPTGPFPLAVARAVHDGLAHRGIVTALQRPRCGRGALVTFVVTVRHRPAQIVRAVEELGNVLATLDRTEVRRAG